MRDGPDRARAYLRALGEMAPEQLAQALHDTLVDREALLEVQEVLLAHQDVDGRLGGLKLADDAKVQAGRGRGAPSIAPRLAHTACVACESNAPAFFI